MPALFPPPLTARTAASAGVVAVPAALTARAAASAGVIAAGETALVIPVLLASAGLAALLGDAALFLVGHPGEATALRGAATAALAASISLLACLATVEYLQC